VHGQGGDQLIPVEHGQRAGRLQDPGPVADLGGAEAGAAEGPLDQASEQ